MEKPQKQELCHLSLSLSFPRPIIDLPENKSDKSMSRRRRVIHHIGSTTFIVELKQEKLGGEIGFVDWEISIIRRIEILRDEISADRFPSKPLLRPRDYTKHGRTKRKGKIVGPRFERFFLSPRSTRLNGRPSCFLRGPNIWNGSYPGHEPIYPSYLPALQIESKKSRQKRKYSRLTRSMRQ